MQWQRLGLTCFRLTKRSKKIQLAIFLNPLLFPASSEKGYLPLVCQATTPPHAVIWGKKKHAQVWQVFQVDKGQQKKTLPLLNYCSLHQTQSFFFFFFSERFIHFRFVISFPISHLQHQFISQRFCSLKSCPSQTSERQIQQRDTTKDMGDRNIPHELTEVKEGHTTFPNLCLRTRQNVWVGIPSSSWQPAAKLVWVKHLSSAS